MQTKIAIQGGPGSFHEQAAKKFFGDDCQIAASETFVETLQKLTTKQTNYAVVAIENSLYGSINEVYDLLLKQKLWVSGEVYLRIEHCLIGLPGATLDQITEVHSQIPALVQCEQWLNTHLPGATRIEAHDTAGSVANIKKWQEPPKAAIASRQAAELYQLPILAENIETHHQNYTRFVIVESAKKTSHSANKTSLVLSTPTDTKPGALYRALGVFYQHNINLTMLQSRPLIGKAWHYLFYVDVDAGLGNQGLQKALATLAAEGYSVTTLGSYPSGQHP